MEEDNLDFACSAQSITHGIPHVQSLPVIPVSLKWEYTYIINVIVIVHSQKEYLLKEKFDLSGNAHDAIAVERCQWLA